MSGAIWCVHVCSGEYSDYAEAPVAAFMTKEQAEECARAWPCRIGWTEEWTCVVEVPVAPVIDVSETCATCKWFKGAGVECGKDWEWHKTDRPEASWCDGWEAK